MVSARAGAADTIPVSLNFGQFALQLDGADGASACQFHAAKADGSAAAANVAYSTLGGFPDDSPSTEFGKFCDTAFSRSGMALSQLWVTPCPLQTPPGTVGDHYALDAWRKLDFGMYEPNLLPADRFYNSHGKDAGPIRGHTLAMLKASLRRARADGLRVSYWTDVHTDFPAWMWKDGLRKNPVRDEMFEEAALHIVYFVKWLTARHGIPVHAASFINEPDLPGRHRFTPEQQLRGAKLLRERLDEAGLQGVRVLPCTAISLSRVRLDWAKVEVDTLRELVELLDGPMKDHAPYVDIIGGHGSQSEAPIAKRPKNTTFWRASGDFNEHWTNTVGFDMGGPEMLDEVIRHNTWLYSQGVAQCGIWQVASRMGIGGDFFRMPETFERTGFGKREAIEGAAAVYPFVRPGMSVVGGSLGRAAREPYSVDGFAGPGQRSAIVITNDGQERTFRIELRGTRVNAFEVYQATPGTGAKAQDRKRVEGGFVEVRVPANSVTTLVANEAETRPRLTVVVKDAAHPAPALAEQLAKLSAQYDVRLVSQELTPEEQDALGTKRHPVDPFGSAAFILSESVDRAATRRAYRTVMAPVIALGEANAQALGVKAGQRIVGGALLNFRDELDPPAELLEQGLPRACGHRVGVAGGASEVAIKEVLTWALQTHTAAGDPGVGISPRPAHARPSPEVGRAARYVERDGLVVMEAEHYQGLTHPNSWHVVSGLSGQAMKVDVGPWSRHLRYDIEFEHPGTYRLHVMGRKNPLAPQYTGNDLKVFFYSGELAQPKVGPGHALFEIGFGEQKVFGWRGTPKSKTVTTTDLKVEKPGLWKLYISGGADEEAGWEIDRLLLTRDNANPPSGAQIGPQESGAAKP